jgi:hypothetical protein
MIDCDPLVKVTRILRGPGVPYQQGYGKIVRLGLYRPNIGAQGGRGLVRCRIFQTVAGG